MGTELRRVGLSDLVAPSLPKRVAPGPRGLLFLGNLLAFRRDVLQLALQASRSFGDIVRFTLGSHVVHLLNHPDHIHYVLQHNQKNYTRNARSAAKIAMICGESLLTTSGSAWLRQRRLVQPVFQPQCAQAFLPVMTEATATMLERWNERARAGQPLAIDAEMSRLTYAIVARSLFGSDVTGEADAVAAAMDVLLDQTYRRLETLVDLPAWLPTPANRRFRQARETIDRIVDRMIADRRKTSGDARDLLALLLRAADEETRDALSDRQLRDQAIALLLSGHQTTADALSWALYLISTHQNVEAGVREEITTVLEGRPPALTDIPRLQYTTMVFHESIRLYPPIWILERRVVEDDEIGGYDIPAGSTVVVSPYTLHRHRSFWPDPDAFLPERFATPISGRQPIAFLPFGAGQHYCIGSHFAQLEVRVVLAMVLQAFSLRLVPGARVTPKGGITLRFREGLPMTLAPHATPSGRASTAPTDEHADCKPDE